MTNFEALIGTILFVVVFISALWANTPQRSFESTFDKSVVSSDTADFLKDSKWLPKYKVEKPKPKRQFQKTELEVDVNFEYLVKLTGSKKAALFAMTTARFESGTPLDIIPKGRGKSAVSYFSNNNFGMTANGSSPHQLTAIEGFVDSVRVASTGKKWGYRIINGDTACIVEETFDCRSTGKDVFRLALTSDSTRAIYEQRLHPHAVYKSVEKSMQCFKNWCDRRLSSKHFESYWTFSEALRNKRYNPYPTYPENWRTVYNRVKNEIE